MKTITRWGIAIVLAVIAAAGYYYWTQHNTSVPTDTPPVVPTVPETAPEAAPQEVPAMDTPQPIEHPIDAPEPAPTLPSVRDSDSLIAGPLSALTGKSAWNALFYHEEIIRRIVTTIDNLPRSEASAKLWPVQPAGSWMETAGGEGNLVISPLNAERYAAYMAVLQKVPVEKVAALYRRYYSLFQQAYADLGYPDAYFNDRLVTVIDHLLATPEPLEAPRLVQEKVIYQFADPDLEQRSAGQKILLRIGVENAQVVKMKLREFRAAITQTSVDDTAAGTSAQTPKP